MAGFKKAFGTLVAGSMLFSSTVVAAAKPAPIATQQVNPWAALAALSAGAPAATICGSSAAATAAAAAAAQGTGGCVLPVVDAPSAPPGAAPAPAPVPPIAAAGPGFGLNPLALGLLALVAGIGIFFAVRGGDKSNTPT